VFEEEFIWVAGLNREGGLLCFHLTVLSLTTHIPEPLITSMSCTDMIIILV
jgi:hypothetical protein